MHALSKARLIAMWFLKGQMKSTGTWQVLGVGHNNGCSGIFVVLSGRNLSANL